MSITGREVSRSCAAATEPLKMRSGIGGRMCPPESVLS
jgi:hypothetical protein